MFRHKILMGGKGYILKGIKVLPKRTITIFLSIIIKKAVMTTFNCNDFLFLPVSMKNESGGKWVEHPQTIGWFFFWPFFYFLILKLYSFLIFYFPSFIFLFNWFFSKIESASSTHTMGWLLAFGPLGSTGQRKIGSHPARHIKLLRKRKRILY